jgi:hypothetical protein
MSRPTPRPGRTVSPLADAGHRSGNTPGPTVTSDQAARASWSCVTVRGLAALIVLRRVWLTSASSPSSARFPLINVQSRNRSPPGRLVVSHARLHVRPLRAPRCKPGLHPHAAAPASGIRRTNRLEPSRSPRPSPRRAIGDGRRPLPRWRPDRAGGCKPGLHLAGGGGLEVDNLRAVEPAHHGTQVRAGNRPVRRLIDAVS